VNEIWRFFYIVVANFIFFDYSLPFIRKKRSTIFYNILIGILLITIHLLLVSVGLYGWRSLGVQLHIFTTFKQPGLIQDEVYYQAQGGVTSLFFFGIAKLFYDNFKLRQTTQQLQIEKQKSELNYLKSQTNPHFLFNTLNNIYSLARDKSDQAPESVLRLSKILRFMLYETGGAYISIEQELKIINDYISLEKLRYDESLHVSFEYQVEDMKQPLPPLLLIPLVENAFKHGVSETRNKPFINIHLSVTHQQLVFHIMNSNELMSKEKGIKENIGLSNLRRQLELLYKDYNLTVEQGESVFKTTLKINLTSHV
jgi:LytS/YehU family sensor histidine kinase